ncbi:glutathione transferase GstA [Gallaecimonas mangrovi]|uniref:glutathione transferase GstA n=1 Tax=Gallaecimonas mangrovi TaxID=2291597 RepID=UPI000E209FAD|nr:glutathione transferase GstA [Gallaecimonas mangrovi]
MKLYYKAGACSLSPHIILEELELPYTTEAVDTKTKKTETGSDYLAINSKGYIPALLLDNGHLLTEGIAIAQYLADQKPQAGLLPEKGETRYQVLSLMAFIATELHKSLGVFFNPNAPEEWKTAVGAMLNKRFAWVSEQIGEQDYLTGKQFTIADAYLFTILNWTRFLNIDLSPWPNLGAFLARVAERPAVQKALKAEGLI